MTTTATRTVADIVAERDATISMMAGLSGEALRVAALRVVELSKEEDAATAAAATTPVAPKPKVVNVDGVEVVLRACTIVDESWDVSFRGTVVGSISKVHETKRCGRYSCGEAKTARWSYDVRGVRTGWLTYATRKEALSKLVETAYRAGRLDNAQ